MDRHDGGSHALVERTARKAVVMARARGGACRVRGRQACRIRLDARVEGLRGLALRRHRDITATNVANLQGRVHVLDGLVRGHEAAPIVAHDTMYIVTPYPNIVYALDLTKPGAPVKWQFEPKPLAAAQGVACCDVVNRGAAYADGRIYFNTLDNQTIALSADTGKELWRARLGDIRNGETMTMAPLVVGNHVLVGNSGGEFGVRGWLTALDAQSGKQVWRAYSTGPDRDVLIGRATSRSTRRRRGKDLGVTSWPGEAWKIGGGNVWGFLSYDADSGPRVLRHRESRGRGTRTSARARIFHVGHLRARRQDRRGGVVLPAEPARPARLRRRQREPPDRSSDRRRDAQDARASRPQRLRVRDGPHERRSAVGHAVRARSRRRRVSTYARDGSSTTRRRTRSRTSPSTTSAPRRPGARTGSRRRTSPRTKLVYIPHQNICQDAQIDAGELHRRHAVRRRDREDEAGTRRSPRHVHRVGSRVREESVEHRRGPSGVERRARHGRRRRLLRHDGRVVQGVDARDGKLLWQFKTGSGIIGQPISYRGPDGKQYVAVLSGVGGWAGAVVSGDLDVRDKTAATGFANLLPDLKQRTTRGGTLYVFSLP
jgi:hypothetical protein